MGSPAVTITPDAPPVTITPDEATPQKSFLDRVNTRIAGNIRSIAEPLKYIHDFAEEVKKRSAQPYVPGQGLKEIGESLQKTYSDPANVLADITTAGILHSIGGGGEEAAPERAVGEAPKPSPTATPKLADLLQDKIQNAAARFVAKRIPGAHMAMDLKELYDALKTEPAPPAAPTPAGPTGPPEQWGQRIPGEIPQTAQSIRAGLSRANTNQPLEAAQPRSYPFGAEPPAPAQPDYVPNRPSIERVIPSEAPPAAKPAPAALGTLLEEATGGQKLVSGVSLKNQPSAMKAAATGKLPEGFTPVESSAVKAYKYNPDAQEFETITKNGQHYIHGDVSPEQAAEFEAADSKGKAWNALRNNSTLVAKVINGKRMPIKPLSAASADPLDETLNKMLEQVQAGKKLSDLR